jgi:hypothetical protein
MDQLTLAELGIDHDPGTAWHPRKPEAYDADGNLRDLNDDEVHEHLHKPESQDQPDARRLPLAAEDSTESPEGEV